MAPTFREILAQTKQEIREINVDGVHAKKSQGDDFLLLDIREKEEYDEGYIEGAHWIPRGFLEIRVENLIPEKETPVVVYCAGGVRSALATKTLESMGYTNVQSMAGGVQAWREKYKLMKPRTLTKEQRSRYSRHISIPEVGEIGQIKLLNSKALLVGAGGLGSPSAYYLAAAGIGTLGIIDADLVEDNNLQRQIIHNTLNIGKPKVESAKETINALNPDVNVVTYQTRLTSENIMEIIEGYDVIVDGSDNFPTRYLVNDACVMMGKPNIHGSIFRFEGQVTAFIPGAGPCYRCLYPSPPPPEFAPT